MKPQKQEKKWPAVLVAGGACAAILLALIIRALNAIFTAAPAGAGPEAEVAAAGASPAAAVHARTEAQPNPAAISVFSAHQVELPGPRPAARAGGPLQQNRVSAGAVFNTDAQKIRERELGRRATIESMRRSALESGDTNAAARQEKKLKKIEESGNSFM